jgi:hypothetical protein
MYETLLVWESLFLEMLEMLFFAESSCGAGLTVTTENGTQFTSCFLATMAQLGVTHRRTADHHPGPNSSSPFAAA